ncbi:MAG: hypothetical protein M3371_05400 [Acidobacteriota bacterium]|nr:hypothetical protein [Acidobacteriota bacterium]
MLQRTLRIALVAVACWPVANVRAAQTNATTATLSPAAERVKARVGKIGSGLKARVHVGLQDGTKLQGFISQIAEQSFVVVRTDDRHIGESLEIAYGVVMRLKAKGVSRDWLRVAAGTAKGLQILHEILKDIGPLRLPPQPRRR